METKRPGEASVQYDDLRGETAADMADELGDLDAAARALGFEIKGTVVGISMFGSAIFDDNVYVTVQVFDGGSWADIKAALDASGGVLRVTEQDKQMPVVEFLKCFKRLKVSLFTSAHEIGKLEIAEAGGE